MPPLGARIAAGRTAEIYAWEAGQVIKLIRPGFPAYLADQEWQCASLAWRLGAHAPQPLQILDVAGRRGVVFERLDGPTLSRAMRRALWRIPQYGRLLGRLHAELHRISAPELPSQAERFRRNLAGSPFLPEDLKAELTALLESLPDGESFCHADFHPENILLAESGPVIIDWESSMRGCPAADVANTCLWIRSAFLIRRGVLGALLGLLGRHFEAAYLVEYGRFAPQPVVHLNEWLAIQAARRMRADNLHESPRLLALIRGTVHPPVLTNPPG
jgi:aminoglycoside phosphotransferase (APT) family kinase protein